MTSPWTRVFCGVNPISSNCAAALTAYLVQLYFQVTTEGWVFQQGETSVKESLVFAGCWTGCGLCWSLVPARQFCGKTSSPQLMANYCSCQSEWYHTGSLYTDKVLFLFACFKLNSLCFTHKHRLVRVNERQNNETMRWKIGSSDAIIRVSPTLKVTI